MKKTILLLLGFVASKAIGQAQRSYRLTDVDIKQRIIWGAEVRLGDGTGLAFGGQDQEADDGRPHTPILVNGDWKPIHEELRRRNRLQPLHTSSWAHRNAVKSLRARARRLYFQGKGLRGLEPDLAALRKKMEADAGRIVADHGDAYDQGRKNFFLNHLKRAAKHLRP
ncbi:MAG: hypothetical protein AAF492_25735, partial [Verrucomicrobiota bacterium]